MSKIFLDFRHGGSDSRTVLGGLVERDINLIIGTSCVNELERLGISVRKSRTSNTELPSLSKRCAMANNWRVDYFVSIHCNAGRGNKG